MVQQYYRCGYSWKIVDPSSLQLELAHDISYPNVCVLTASIEKWNNNIYIYIHRSGTYFTLLIECIVSSPLELLLIPSSESRLV